jgi:hypothetical protein
MCTIITKGRFRFYNPVHWRTKSPSNVWIPFGFTSVIWLSKRFFVAFRIRQLKGVDHPRYFLIAHDVLNKSEHRKPWLIWDSRTVTRTAYLYFWDQCNKHFGEDFAQAASHISRRDSCFRTFGVDSLEIEEHCRIHQTYYGTRNKSDDPTRLAATLLHIKHSHSDQLYPQIDRNVFAKIAKIMTE